MPLTLGPRRQGCVCSRKEGKICSPANRAQPGGIYADEFDRDRQILLFGTQRRRQARTASVLLSSSDKRACMPAIHGELDGCFLRLTKARANTPLSRSNSSGSTASRQAHYARSAQPHRFFPPESYDLRFPAPRGYRPTRRFLIRSVFAREQAPRSSWLRCSRLCRSASTRSGCRGQGSAGATTISILTVSAAAIRSASYTPPPAARPIVFRTKKIFSAARASRSALSDVRQCRMRRMAEPDLSTCLERFSDLARCMLGLRKASRTKENPSHDHLTKKYCRRSPGSIQG